MENTNENQIIENPQQLNELLKIRHDKLKELREKGKDPFGIVKAEVTHHSKEIKENFEEFDQKEVYVAGRIMSKRVMGKASFCDIQDRDGRIQSYVSKNEIGEEGYTEFKKFDIGDIIAIKGVVFKTQKEEISIKAYSVTLLSKAYKFCLKSFTDLKTKTLDIVNVM